MKILFITAFPPNQKTAGQDYTCRLLKDFIERGHNISLIYFTFPGHSIDISPKITVLKCASPSVKNILNAPAFFPFFSKRFDMSVLHFINSVKESFDLLYFDFSQVHIYSYFINHPCKVLMCHDVILQKAGRQFPIFLPWVRSSEKSILKSASHIITFSKKDSRLLDSAYGLVSHPVNFYLKGNSCFLPEKKHHNDFLNDTFCFYGAWNRKENSEALIWFIKKVRPLLKEVTAFKFKVIGSGMSEKTASFISRIPGFEYIGFVEDPVSEIARCEALIAPLLKGAGVKVKVIDALSCGTKVIGTYVTFEGIEDNKKNPLFVRCSSAADFADTLNNWKLYGAGNKSVARDEFCARYSINHFPDLIETFLVSSYQDILQK